jgi:amidase
MLSEETTLHYRDGPMAGNPSTGPVYVEGIRAGDVIAVTIEELDVLGHTLLGAGGADTLLPAAMQEAREDFVRIEHGVAQFPGGVTAPVRPMYGCFGVVPSEACPEPYGHGGNMDIPDVCAGNTVHVRCQRDGAYFACGDGHALQGDGEINGFSLEVSLRGRLRIDMSPYQTLGAMLIETPDRHITVGVKRDMKESVTDAVTAMAELFADARGVTVMDAYQFVSHVGDLRVGAIWPLWSEYDIPIPMCLHLAREHFV